MKIFLLNKKISELCRGSLGLKAEPLLEALDSAIFQEETIGN